MIPCKDNSYIIKPQYKHINGETKKAPSDDIEIPIDLFNKWKVYGPTTLKDALEIAPILFNTNKYNL